LIGCWYYSIYRKKWVVSKCVKYVKIRWFCVEKVRIEALKGEIFHFNEITKITECTRVPVVYAWESVYTDGKWSTQQMYDFGFSRRFILVRLWYLSSLEAYTNNWGLFGKENYLTFDWWKHFLKILRRSEVTINLTRQLKKMEASEFVPL
jgi:hypothetical protein